MNITSLKRQRDNEGDDADSDDDDDDSFDAYKDWLEEKGYDLGTYAVSSTVTTSTCNCTLYSHNIFDNSQDYVMTTGMKQSKHTLNG